MKRRVILLGLILPLLQAAAQQPDASQIMDKSRDQSITGSLNATVVLTITEKGGSIRNRIISMMTKSYADGLEKRIIRFIEPADVRGTSMLVVDYKNSADEMWIYLPALKKTRRIVTSEKGKSFMSSEFSNADMSSPAISDFTHKHLEKSGTNNQWIIESIPVNEDKADEYGFSKKISYISIDNNQVLKMEFYNFDKELFKVIEIKSIFPMSDGKFMVKNMVATNLNTNRKSEILFSNINEGVKIDDSNFTIQNLER
jgi:outer membrane lipoprotein-sorting protein